MALATLPRVSVHAQILTLAQTVPRYLVVPEMQIVVLATMMSVILRLEAASVILVEQLESFVKKDFLPPSAPLMTTATMEVSARAGDVTVNLHRPSMALYATLFWSIKTHKIMIMFSLNGISKTRRNEFSVAALMSLSAVIRIVCRIRVLSYRCY